MKKIIVTMGLTSLFIFSFPSQAVESNPEVVNQLLKSRAAQVKRIARKRELVQAVKQQNAEDIGLDEIKNRDQEWQANIDSPFKRELKNNKAALALKKLIDRSPHIYSEAYLTDNQGANVAMYPLATTDYWQGDKAKWSNSFNNGDGQVVIGPARYDEVTRTRSIPISAPVTDRGETIGVLIIGIKYDYVNVQGRAHHKHQ